MFGGNRLTFNPDWYGNAQNLEEFTDVRDVEKQLKANGIKLDEEDYESTSGIEQIMLTDAGRRCNANRLT